MTEEQDAELSFVCFDVFAELIAAEALFFDENLKREVAFAELALGRDSAREANVFLDNALDPLPQTVLVHMFDAAWAKTGRNEGVVSFLGSGETDPAFFVGRVVGVGVSILEVVLHGGGAEVGLGVGVFEKHGS